VPVVSVSPITNTISGENAVISSHSVDIDSSIDIDPQSNLDIPIAHCNGKRSCILHPLHNFLAYA